MSFRDIIGHKGPIGLLRSAIRKGRLPNAYLFSGEDAIGKRLVATSLAKAVNCQDEGEDSCNECPSCRMADGGIHPDIEIIAADGTQIKIGQIRSLQEKLVYKPYKGKRRVCIIDEADKMTIEASNSFLKTLEEPLGYTTIILITSRPNSLPATLLSRCELIRFVPPPTDLIKDLLINKKGMGCEKAQTLAIISMGRVGKAFNEEKEEMIAERDRIIDLVPRIVKEGASRIFESASNISELPDEMDRVIFWLLIILRDLLVYKVSHDPSMIINRDRIAEIESMGKGASPDGIIKVIDEVRMAERLIARNVNKQLTLEHLFISISSLQ